MTPANFDTLAKLGTQVLSRHIVPICEKDVRGLTQGHGTGLLVSNNESNFLVTAAHVLEPLKEGRRLFIPAGKNAERNLFENWREPIRIDSAHTTDVAVLRFERDARPPYFDLGLVGIPFANLKSRALPRKTKDYFVTGFPATRVKHHIKNQTVEIEPLGNKAPSIDDALYEKFGLDPNTSIALDFDVNSIRRRNGILQAAPEPQGMSGSPVWELFEHAGPNDSKRNQVVRILIEHRRKDKLLVATDISVAKDLIIAYG